MVKKSKNKNINETDITFKKFVILFIIMIVIVIGVYFLSVIIVDNRDNKNEKEVVSGQVDYSVVTVGTMLNRPYDEYLVMIYDSTSSNAVYYSALISGYQSKENSLKLYFCDLNNELNKSFVTTDGNTNIKSNNFNDLKFGDITLLKIKDREIKAAFENLDEIKNALQ